MRVLSFVSAQIVEGRRPDVVEPYRRAVAEGLPDGCERTFLLAGDDGMLAIATLWESRDALDAMRSSGEEPLARRLLREAGGTPAASFFDVVAEGGAG